MVLRWHFAALAESLLDDLPEQLFVAAQFLLFGLPEQPDDYRLDLRGREVTFCRR